jgi:hypothetical protein
MKTGIKLIAASALALAACNTNQSNQLSTDAALSRVFARGEALDTLVTNDTAGLPRLMRTVTDGKKRLIDECYHDGTGEPTQALRYLQTDSAWHRVGTVSRDCARLLKDYFTTK